MENKNIILEVSRMKSLFNYQRGVVISEQYKSQEEAIYFTVARAVVDPGTNEELLKKAFQMVQNSKQFVDVEKMMRQRPIAGYKTWAAVLKGEFSAGDGYWMKQYADILKPKGVNLSHKLGGMNKNQLETNTIAFTTAPVNTQQLANQPVTAKGDDYFKNPDGSIQVKELPGVTVVGKKKGTQPANNQLTFVAEKFPLKYMMQGENVKTLQQTLGLKNPTGKFYNQTNAELEKRAKELGISYDKNVGLDEDSFNLIVSGSKPQTQMAQPVTTTTPINTKGIQAPTNLTPKAPQIQIAQQELTLDQQFQQAKANLQKAKAELDAAQKTKDRVQIGTARGKQQAARQEVQRMRNELSNQGKQQ